MAADVHFQTLDKRGEEILDELERRTQKPPYLTTETGERAYWLEQDVGVEGFDVMLDKIAADWREHLTR